MAKPTIHIHRFHNCGAIAVLNNSDKTAYLNAQEVRHTAKVLMKLARDLERNTFLGSDFKDAEIVFTDRNDA